MKKSLIFLVTASMLMTACSAKSNANEPSNEFKTIIDSAGAEVQVPSVCDEIICVWPSGTQLMITLGMGDLLTGVSADSKEQSWAVEMYPRLAELTECSNEESSESLLNLNADIILTTESDVAEQWRSKGITAVTFKYYSLDEMRTTLSTLSEIVPDEYKDNCTDYISYLDNNIAAVSEALEGKIENKDTLYYIHGNNNKGLYKTAGGGTMNETWANAAYTDFATSDLLASNETVVDAEAILNKNPDVIVIGGRYQDTLKQELLGSDEWKEINAVKNGRVYTVPYGISPFDRFGAEFALMVPWTASTVYSDLYSYDIKEEVKAFYSRFTGFELSDEQAGFIVNGLGPDGKADIDNE